MSRFFFLQGAEEPFFLRNLKMQWRHSMGVNIRQILHIFEGFDKIFCAMFLEIVPNDWLINLISIPLAPQDAQSAIDNNRRARTFAHGFLNRRRRSWKAIQMVFDEFGHVSTPIDIWAKKHRKQAIWIRLRKFMSHFVVYCGRKNIQNRKKTLKYRFRISTPRTAIVIARAVPRLSQSKNYFQFLDGPTCYCNRYCNPKPVGICPVTVAPKLL